MTRREILDRYAEISRPIMLRYVTEARSCIASSWVTVAVLKTLRIHAEAHGFKMRVINKTLAAVLLGLTEEAASKVDWAAVGLAGGREVAIGHNDPATVEASDYNGHVAVYVPCRGVLVDPSLDQVARPAFGITVPAIGLWRVGRLPQPGRPVVFVNDKTGVVVEYERLTDRDFERAKDWKHGAARYGAAAREILLALDA